MLEIPAHSCHVAVRVENHIIVFGGFDENFDLLSLRNIWMYNVYTEEWGKHVIRDGIIPPGAMCSGAVVIEGDIYMFGGSGHIHEPDNFTNAMWKLTRTPKCCFEWRKGKERVKKKAPSPRNGHSVWEYKGRLLTFGGGGPPLKGYLNNHGDFNGDDHYYGTNPGQNNQLLCYYPLTEDWRNLKPSGTIPKPRASHASTISGDKVWIYGGYSTDPFRVYDELYQLNMVSLTWTKIQSGQLRPRCRKMCSLTAVTENQIVLHGGRSTSNEILSDTWIFDLSLLSWKKCEASKCKPRCGHTANVGTNSGIIGVGGQTAKIENRRNYIQFYSGAFSVKLEPKTLQQQAIQKIHQHRDMLSWNLLRDTLRDRFLFPVIVADGDE